MASSAPASSVNVAPDGQRFLMLATGRGADAFAARPGIVVVQKWFEELRRLLPAN